MRSDFDVREKYVGTGLLDEYTFDFKIDSLGQLLVVEYDDDGAETQRVRGTDTTYLDSVSFDASAGGGTVTLADPLTDGYTLALLLADDTPTQEDSYKNKFDFTLKNIENSLDKLSGQIQRVAYLSQRGTVLPDLLDDGDFDPTLPSDIISGEAGRILAVNDAKTGWEFGPTTDSIFQAATDAQNAADDAADSATAADVSEAAAAVSETNAGLAQIAAELAETNAETAQAAAEAAQAAAEAAQAAAEAAVISAGGAPADAIALTDGQQEVVVVFQSAFDFGATDYGIGWTLESTEADDDLQFLLGVIKSKSSTGFTIRFHAPVIGNNMTFSYNTRSNT